MDPAVPAQLWLGCKKIYFHHVTDNFFKSNFLIQAITKRTIHRRRRVIDVPSLVAILHHEQ